MIMSPVEEAAVRWWRSKAPLGYDDEAHLKNTGINLSTNSEISLAYAVAVFIERQKRETV